MQTIRNKKGQITSYREKVYINGKAITKSFKRKIDVLSNFSDAMGGEEEFIERVKNLLMDLIPTLQEYGEQLQITNQMFGSRLSNTGRSQFGSGFSSN